MDAADEFGKSRIGSKRFEMWIDANKGEAYCMFAFSLRQPFESVIVVAQPTVDDRDLVGRNILFITIRNYLLNQRTRFILFSGCRQNVGALRLSSWRIAGKHPLLFISGKGFGVHAFLL